MYLVFSDTDLHSLNLDQLRSLRQRLNTRLDNLAASIADQGCETGECHAELSGNGCSSLQILDDVLTQRDMVSAEIKSRIS